MENNKDKVLINPIPKLICIKDYNANQFYELANTKYYDDNGFTAFMIAASVNNVEAMKNILNDYPYILDSKDNYNKTAIYWAVWYNSFEAIKFLLEKGAELNHCSEPEDYNILHVVTVRNNISLINVFLYYGCNRMCIDAKGNTALDYAKSDEARNLLMNYHDINNCDIINLSIGSVVVSFQTNKNLKISQLIYILKNKLSRNVILFYNHKVIEETEYLYAYLDKIIIVHILI